MSRLTWRESCRTHWKKHVTKSTKTSDAFLIQYTTVSLDRGEVNAVWDSFGWIVADNSMLIRPVSGQKISTPKQLQHTYIPQRNSVHMPLVTYHWGHKDLRQCETLGQLRWIILTASKWTSSMSLNVAMSTNARVTAPYDGRYTKHVDSRYHISWYSLTVAQFEKSSY